MRNDKLQALKLRRTGKSYNEIKQLLGIPKSTLSAWLQKTNWSDMVKRRLTAKNNRHHSIRIRQLDAVRGKRLTQLYKQAKIQAKIEFGHLKFHPLFIAGIAIYWGEGNKASPHNVVVGNTDPAMIKVFVKFLAEVCGLPQKRIRAYVLLYPDLNDDECKKFWIKHSGLTSKNFNKSVVIKGRHKTRRVTQGVCNITVSSKYLKIKMLEWLNLLAQELIQNYYKRV